MTSTTRATAEAVVIYSSSTDSSSTSFLDLGLDPKLVAVVVKKGYSTPSSIQEQAIPVVLSGKDVVGLAQTGTGKTAAFALPLIQRLMKQGTQRSPRALIVAPTRELAEQINQAIELYSAGTGLRCLSVYGGVSMGMQVKRLQLGIDIVVGCPGRLVDHLSRRSLNLSKLEVLVLDEADHMFDMGFLPDIRRLMTYVPKQRQTLLFSATMPAEIKHLAHEVLTNPETIQVSHGEMAASVTHALFPVTQQMKTPLLHEILKKFAVKSTIVFTRTKHRTKKLADVLERSGYEVTSLQGNLSQARRQEAIDGFKKGRYQILVATDIAARGIDVQQVTHVINFDMPSTVEAYTHRIGRTGRAAREGEAFTFICKEDEAQVRNIERKLGTKIERRVLENFTYGSDDRGQESSSQGAPRTANRPENRERRESSGRGDYRGGRPQQSRSPERASTTQPREDGRIGSVRPSNGSRQTDRQPSYNDRSYGDRAQTQPRSSQPDNGTARVPSERQPQSSAPDINGNTYAERSPAARPSGGRGGSYRGNGGRGGDSRRSGEGSYSPRGTGQGGGRYGGGSSGRGSNSRGRR